MAETTGRVGWRNYVSPISPLWNSLVAYWSGDNTANDSKGTYNGTLINGATYSTGKIGSGFSLDGVNDYVNISPVLGSTFSAPGSAHSYSAWIYPTSLSGYNWIIQNGLNNSGTSMILNGANLCFFVQGGNNQTTSSATLALNTWTMVTVVYNGAGSVSFYKNGALINSSGASWTETVAAAGSNTYIGSYVGAVHFFDGKIDEVGAWSRALTAAEVSELYNGGAGKQYVAPTPSYTARTVAFAAATGITDTTILNALNTFDTGLISNGLATKMKALYPFVGGTANTHKFNFMDARDTNAAFRLQFNGGWIHSANGIQGNQTNTYANTFLNENTVITANSEHICIYSRTNVDGLFCDIGVVTSGDIETNIFSKLSNKFYYRINNSNNGVANLNTSLGLFVATKNSPNLVEGWNKNTKSNISSTFVSKINAPIYIGAYNYSNMSTFLYPTARQYSFSSIGDGLTDADASNLYTLVQSLQTSLSRQV